MPGFMERQFLEKMGNYTFWSFYPGPSNTKGFCYTFSRDTVRIDKQITDNRKYLYSCLGYKTVGENQVNKAW